MRTKEQLTTLCRDYARGLLAKKELDTCTKEELDQLPRKIYKMKPCTYEMLKGHKARNCVLQKKIDRLITRIKVLKAELSALEKLQKDLHYKVIPSSKEVSLLTAKVIQFFA